MLEYFTAYANKHKLLPFISFNTEVVRAEEAKQGAGLWGEDNGGERIDCDREGEMSEVKYFTAKQVCQDAK